MQPEEGGDAMQERFFTGYAAGDQFGYSVSSAGDVNSDGYADLIVGAPFNDAGGLNAGRAYIYFGGSIINSGVDVILTGLAASDRFGFYVSTAGDVNGDGYSDVIVGAPFNNAGGTDAGRAYIYFGGSAMNNVADLIMTGEAAGDQLEAQFHLQEM
ncbi:MAG: FG-GAP repeat protein [Ignavibacteria bacterium]|nr:FG-GAP repeat protein [Ignavibacteria bacterium]